MKERREGRIGTVSGLALLAGGTALAAAVGGDHQSLSATLLLGTLTVGLGHSLIEEMKRQARRAQPRWTREDTTNAVLLGVWAEAALLMSMLAFDTWPTHGLGMALAVAYAACCGFFVTERRRALTPQTSPTRRSSTAPQTTDPTANAPGIADAPRKRDTAANAPRSAEAPHIADTTAGAPRSAEAPRATGTTAAALGIVEHSATATAPSTTGVSGAAATLENAETSGPVTAPHAASAAGGVVLPGGGAVLKRRPAGPAPTAGHGPMTRSHAAGHASTLPGHSHPASLPGPAAVAPGRPATVRSEAPR